MTHPHPQEAATIPGPPDPAGFRAAMGSFLTGVAVMTTKVNGEPHGMTANAVSSVSLEPPLVLVCVAEEAIMAERVRQAGVFALSFLAEDQRALSNRFADPSRGEGAEEFEGVEVEVAATGCPVITGATAMVDCRVTSITAAGDHLVVIGEVVALDTAGDAPLGYYRGGYGVYTAEPSG